MKPLSYNDIESELSYAYLHAVASKIGASCVISNRHEGNHGVDAKITAWGPFNNGGILEEIDIKIQLKATRLTPKITNNHFSYILKGINQYNDLRCEAKAVPRLLVVMFLPDSPDEWLKISSEELILRKCAYWVSLRGAS